MPTKLFVGNVSAKATEDDLKEAFEKYGKVVQHAIVRSYGFVHYEKQEDAEKAIKELDDTEFKGSVIKVELSKTPHKNGNWVHRDLPQRDYNRNRYYRGYDERDRYYDGYRERPPMPPPGRYRPYGYRESYGPPSAYDRDRYYDQYYGRSRYDYPGPGYSGEYSYTGSYSSSRPRPYPASSSTGSNATRESYDTARPPVSYPSVASKTTAESTTTTSTDPTTTSDGSYN